MFDDGKKREATGEVKKAESRSQTQAVETNEQAT